MATISVPQTKNTLVFTAVHKKGDATVANNYYPESVMRPLSKLYMVCLNNQISMKADNGNWRAPTRVGFCKEHCREDLIIAKNYLLDRANAEKYPIALCYANFEKVFDTVPRDQPMYILADCYGLANNIVEDIRHMYMDVLW